MKKKLAVALSIAVTGAVSGAGIERTSQSTAILFEVGRYAEISIGSVSPSVSGVAALGTPGVSSGNMGAKYTSVALGYKQNIGKNIDIALIIDEPVGANVNYAGSGYLIEGSKATLDSTAITGLMKYKFPSNVSVYGGIRSQSLGGVVHLEKLGSPDYDLKVGQKHELGYVAGVAFEKPEIALRVALTYNSEIKHDFNDVKEGLPSPLPPGLPPQLAFGPSSPFSVTVPKSVNLEFQSGVAKDTLVFGSVRWVEWSKFDISPAKYNAIASDSLVDFKDDRTAYNIGVGRKINDKWSAAVSLGYEPSVAGTCNRAVLPATGCTGNLGPTDGSKSVGLALIYKMKKAKVTAGVRYVKVGDADTSFADFRDNDALGFGVKVGFNF